MPPAPSVTFDPLTQVGFAPSTTVSAHFMGAERNDARAPDRCDSAGTHRPEPDLRRLAAQLPDADEPALTLDRRGRHFRLLFDPTCASRNRPNCGTGGGGDSENEVNPYNGNLYFLDQEALVVNEGLGSSTDHGDTFPLARDHAITNSATGVDRQWLAPIDPNVVSIGPRKIEGFLSYHVPIAGQYIQGIDQDGVPIDQPVPQIVLVSQSGQLRVDNSRRPRARLDLPALPRLGWGDGGHCRRSRVRAALGLAVDNRLDGHGCDLPLAEHRLARQRLHGLGRRRRRVPQRLADR